MSTLADLHEKLNSVSDEMSVCSVEYDCIKQYVESTSVHQLESHVKVLRAITFLYKAHISCLTKIKELQEDMAELQDECKKRPRDDMWDTSDMKRRRETTTTT